MLIFAVYVHEPWNQAIRQRSDPLSSYLNSHVPCTSGLGGLPEGRPFSIDVEPEKITAEPGDEIVFSIRIEAEEGFSDSIDLELRLSGLGVSITLGTLDPPYSKEFDVTVNIPSDIPEVNVQGILRGISGEHIVEKYLEINIQGKAGIMHAIWQIFDNLANGLAKIVRDKIQAMKDLIKEIWRIRGNSTDRDKILP